MARQQAGTTITAIRGGAVTLAEAVDAFLSSPRVRAAVPRRPQTGPRPPARPRDICPHTGRARLGYDRARVLFKKHTATAASGGLDLHQLRHSAATHLGDQKVPLQLIMAKTRHQSPRTVMRYVKPGDEAVAEVTSLLGPPRRTH
ncbi:MAG TPA: tyrosine-type recombinase/integrase [Trebonia sp.]|jgi:integrase